jgi:hypothetical protein
MLQQLKDKAKILENEIKEETKKALRKKSTKVMRNKRGSVPELRKSNFLISNL